MRPEDEDAHAPRRGGSASPSGSGREERPVDVRHERPPRESRAASRSTRGRSAVSMSPRQPRRHRVERKVGEHVVELQPRELGSELGWPLVEGERRGTYAQVRGAGRTTVISGERRTVSWLSRRRSRRRGGAARGRGRSRNAAMEPHEGRSGRATQRMFGSRSTRPRKAGSSGAGPQRKTSSFPAARARSKTEPAPPDTDSRKRSVATPARDEDDGLEHVSPTRWRFTPPAAIVEDRHPR